MKLGQVALNYIPGFTTPFPSYAPPGVVAAAPSGGPLYSEQINDPDFVNSERHCYKCPDGTMRSMTIPAARAAGCEARDLSECGAAALSGAAQRALGKMKMGQTSSLIPIRPSIIAGVGLAGFGLGSHFVSKENKVLKGALVLGAVLSGLTAGYLLYVGK